MLKLTLNVNNLLANCIILRACRVVSYITIDPSCHQISLSYTYISIDHFSYQTIGQVGLVPVDRVGHEACQAISHIKKLWTSDQPYSLPFSSSVVGHKPQSHHITGSVFTNHSQEHSLSFSPRFVSLNAT